MHDIQAMRAATGASLRRLRQQGDGRTFYDSTLTFIFVAATSLGGSRVTLAKHRIAQR